MTMYKPYEALLQTYLFKPLLRLISLSIDNQLLLALALPSTWSRGGTSSAPAFLQGVFKRRIDAGEGKPGISCFDDKVDIFEHEGKLGERFGHVTGEP